MKTGTNLTTIVNKTAPTVQKAMGALAAMGRELDQPSTYEQIRKIECAAEAMRQLYAHVDEVKCECEVVILMANRRMALETAKLPMAARGKSSKSSRKENLGRGATGIPAARRSRQKKLIPLSKSELREVAKKILRKRQRCNADCCHARTQGSRE